jgi:signal recognition particle subunit SRP54
MIPKIGKMVKDVDIDENAFKATEAIIMSMTPKEREQPALIDMNRRKRIAKGSGTHINEVNKLMKQFEETRKMMKTMTNKEKMKQMMKKR